MEWKKKSYLNGAGVVGGIVDVVVVVEGVVVDSVVVEVVVDSVVVWEEEELNLMHYCNKIIELTVVGVVVVLVVVDVDGRVDVVGCKVVCPN